MLLVGGDHRNPIFIPRVPTFFRRCAFPHDLTPDEARSMFQDGYQAGMAFFETTQVPEEP